MQYLPHPKTPFSLTPGLMLWALLLALLWWFISLMMRGGDGFLVWIDQEITFVRGLEFIARPYDVPGFVNAPWALMLTAPFNLMPLSIAVLLQMLLYFGLLAAVIVKLGGDRTAVLLTLSSPLALDNAINLNIDWIVCLGLLVPAAYSGPLLLVKPQNAIGYLLSFKWPVFVRWVGVTSAVLLISFLIWGGWPVDLLESMGRSPVSWGINLSPMELLPLPAALLIGVGLGVYAFRRRDPALSILAGLFFVPYIASYSMLLPFGLIAIRVRLVAIVSYVMIWLLVIYTVMSWLSEMNVS